MFQWGISSSDGAIDNLVKFNGNIILHTPCPLFINFAMSDLKLENISNVVVKLEETIHHLNKTVTMRNVSNFASDSCNWLRDVRKHL